MPDKSAVFNVAIRTLLIDTEKGTAEMGIGSGITSSSDPKKEYNECLLKARFLTEPFKIFDLIETILWEPYSGYFLLQYHIERLARSAQYFGYPCNRTLIEHTLKDTEILIDREEFNKIRLLLSSDGALSVTTNTISMDQMFSEPQIVFSHKTVNSNNIYLYHKTTNRNLYNNEYAFFREKGFLDVIFTNEKGEITEGAVSNIFIKKDGKYYTPPISCGLLNGTYRQYFLAESDLPVYEKVLYKKDIIKADEIYIANSVRKLQKVTLHNYASLVINNA